MRIFSFVVTLVAALMGPALVGEPAPRALPGSGAFAYNGTSVVADAPGMVVASR